MLTECIHLYDDARKCRRIPKRGDKYCAAHRANPSLPRNPGDEDAAFIRQIEAFVAHLHTLPLEDLLDTAAVSLSNLFPAIHTRLSRRTRLLFTRASVAASLASERMIELKRDLARPPRQVPSSRLPARPSQLPAPGAPPDIPNRAEIARLLERCRNSPSPSPDELEEILREARSLLEPDAIPEPQRMQTDSPAPPWLRAHPSETTMLARKSSWNQIDTPAPATHPPACITIHNPLRANH